MSFLAKSESSTRSDDTRGQLPRKRQTDAAKIRALHEAGLSKEEIIAKGFTRQQWEGALSHTKPMGRPKKPRCPLCGAIIKDEMVAASILKNGVAKKRA